MDQRKKCADICDVAQVTDIHTLPNWCQLISIDVNWCQLISIDVNW